MQQEANKQVQVILDANTDSMHAEEKMQNKISFRLYENACRCIRETCFDRLKFQTSPDRTGCRLSQWTKTFAVLTCQTAHSQKGRNSKRQIEIMLRKNGNRTRRGNRLKIILFFSFISKLASCVRHHEFAVRTHIVSRMIAHTFHVSPSKSNAGDVACTIG